MKVSDVFGIKKDVSSLSYIDRGELDISINKYLQRDKHITIKGESKCGKSWLRQQNLPDAIVVQCRLYKEKNDIYVDALSQLDVSFEVKSSEAGKVCGNVSASGDIGAKLLAKVGLNAAVSGEKSDTKEFNRVGCDISDLRYIADIIKASEKRLVIEDFHYLAKSERKSIAYDLKALWDYGVYVVIIGIWSESNLLSFLNTDLAGRIYEIELYWTEEELRSVIRKGSEELNVDIEDNVIQCLIDCSYGNVGIMQELALDALDKSGIEKRKMLKQRCTDNNKVIEASMFYSEQLNPIYKTLTEKISAGIRRKQNSTDAYLHMIVALLECTDSELIDGIHIDTLFERVKKRESRINKGNLKKSLSKLEELQVDKDGRGLVFSFNDADKVHVVDKQILLYRKHMTVKWPWEEES